MTIAKDFLVLVYKILTPSQWEAFDQLGSFLGSPLDQQDGFIHLSSASQAVETANKYFSNEPLIYLVTIDAAALATNLKWEASRGGDLFPHLYAKLERAVVVSTEAVNRSADGRFDFAVR